MFRILGLAAALLLTMTTPARAQLRAISDGATPVVSGARVLWGERVGAGSADVIPPGPCVRSEVAVAGLGDGRAEITCLSTPAATCRVSARGRTARIARGRTRALRVGRGPVRVTDPDGRARTVFDGS